MVGTISSQEFNKRIVSRRKFIFEEVPKAGAVALGAYTLLDFGFLAARVGSTIAKRLLTQSTPALAKDSVQNQPDTKIARYVEPEIIIDKKISNDLGEKLASHLAIAKNWNADETEIGRAIYKEQAQEILKFAQRAKELLKENKQKLTKIATLTDVGEKEPEFPTDEIRKDPENSKLLPENKFMSGHFGPQEFINLKHSRLARMNLAIPIAISIIENGSDSRLYSRLVGQQQFAGLHWDAFNAHKGRDAGRFLSGIINSRIFSYGQKSRGGILATGGTVNSSDINDRFQVLLQPIILTFRCMRFSPKGENNVVDFELNNKNGQPDYNFIANYLLTQEWSKRFQETYKALQEFCKQYPEYNWILTESIV